MNANGQIYDNTEQEFLQMQLYRLGVHRNYEGFVLVVEAAILVKREEERRSCMKSVYIDVAKRNHMSKDNVRRDIATLVRVIWRDGNKKLLEEMAGRELAKSPTCQEFVWLLADYIKRQGEPEESPERYREPQECRKKPQEREENGADGRGDSQKR